MKNFFPLWNRSIPKSKLHLAASGQHAIDWVLPQRLATGAFPRASAQPALLEAGIQTIITLCAEHEGILSPEISQTFHCFYLPLPDSHYTGLLEVEQLEQAVELLKQCLDNNRSVYIHCLAGVERSPSVCMAYLCRYHHVEVWEALHWMKQVHANTRPTPEQIQVIQRFTQTFTQPATQPSA